MKLSRTTVVVPLAGLLLIGAAGAVAATSGDPAPAETTVVAAPSATPAPSAGTTVTPPKDTVLTDVLDELVAKGTITAAQKTAIVDAVGVERTARREARQAAREQLRTLFEDGVLTQAEFDQLPADSPIRAITGLMDDGQITKDELRGIGRGLLGGGRGGHGLGLGGDRPDDDATVTPSASPTTGG